MNDVTTLFREHMKMHGADWVEDQGVVSRDPKQLFWVAGAAPILHNGLRAYEYNLASSQTCLRMNMFENIGMVSGKHICFPMLGHFSFFRHDLKSARQWSIESAWSFLIERLCVDRDSLVVSRHEDDNITADVWNELGVPNERIECHRDKHTAEFIQGAQGFRTKIGVSALGGVTRFWGIVFVDTFKTGVGPSDGTILVDSGMSLDRLLMITEQKTSSYATTRWSTLVNTLTTCEGGRLSQVDLNRLADVGRSASILLMSGIEPGPKKHNYVLRKLLREVIGLTGSYLQFERFEEVMQACLADAVNQYNQQLQVIDQKKALAVSLVEHRHYSQTIKKALQRQETLLARKGELDDRDREELVSTFGLPTRLLC